MDNMELEQILTKQRNFFAANVTKSVNYRIECLKKLRSSLIRYEREIEAALFDDLGKSHFESVMTEIGMVHDELNYMIRNIPRLSKAKRKKVSLSQFPARSYSVPEPYGTVLIMSPWNYPFLLSIDPLIDALAAGNTVILKPSAYAPSTSKVLAALLKDCLPAEVAAVVEGGRDINSSLLDMKFDYIFFTGSVAVGKLVMKKASEFLTPVTLELGGKSPCIVDETANLKIAAKRIVFGKFLNLGQTCVAPDYLFVHSSVKDALVAEIKTTITKFLGNVPLDNEHYGKIINEKHFQRLIGLMDGEKILVGGEYDNRLRIAPTLLDHITADSPCMQEEIFGPILPVLTFDSFADVVSFVNSRPKPLALYLFTQSKERMEAMNTTFTFGGGCINDTVLHLASSYNGFGGVGESGMGSYHGEDGFLTFSHRKNLLHKKLYPDISLRYHPYTHGKMKTLKRFMHM